MQGYTRIHDITALTPGDTLIVRHTMNHTSARLTVTAPYGTHGDGYTGVLCHTDRPGDNWDTVLAARDAAQDVVWRRDT